MKKQLTNEHYRQVADEYNRMVKAKNYKTGNMYRDAVKELFAWLDKEGVSQVTSITAKHLTSYLAYLTTRPNRIHGGVLAVATVNQHLFSIQLLFDHLVETGYLKEIVQVPGYLTRTHNPFALLTEDEVKDLYKHCQNPAERALLSVAYGCGLRRSEIRNLNTSDILYHKGMLVVTKGKGNKVREVAMNDVVIEDLKRYHLTERLDRIRSAGSRVDAFFVNAKGERLSGDSLNEMLKTIVLRTGNTTLIDKKVSLHCLRHSITTHLVERGMGIEPLRRFLGHKEIDTTSLYMARRKRRNKFII